MKTVPPAGVTNGRIKPRSLSGHPALHAYVMPSSLSRHRTLIPPSTQGQRGHGSGLGVRWHAPTVCSGRRERAAGVSSGDGLPDQLGDVEDQIRPAVRERRLALGLSQGELAARADMIQPALSRLEAGGVVPTIPLLERISAPLDADLIVQLAPHAA